MKSPIAPDWNPLDERVVRDQHAAYDELRERCPVAYSDFMQWSVLRHEDVTRVAMDPLTFSNVVSTHVSVPNGMDPPEHTPYRRLIEPYFAPHRMDAFAPVCRKLSAGLVKQAVAKGEVEWMADLATPLSARMQCAFLGWPEDLPEHLLRWTRCSQAATLAQDREALSSVAQEFADIIGELLASRRRAGAKPEDDLTASLMHEQVDGRPLNDEELTSILRNWTVGEINTISASIGILANFLATHLSSQDRFRAEPSLLPAAIDEILRLHGPLVANRRITTCPVQIGGRHLDAGAQISMNWLAANRDGRAFPDPLIFRLDRDPALNFLYGAGLHVCPGAPLARLEMKILLEELLQATTQIRPATGSTPRRAVYPSSGFEALPLRLDSIPTLRGS